MALVGYIAVVIAIIIVIAIIRLLRDSDNTSAIAASYTCPACGRKRELLRCAYCQSRQGSPFDV